MRSKFVFLFIGSLVKFFGFALTIVIFGCQSETEDENDSLVGVWTMVSVNGQQPLQGTTLKWEFTENELLTSGDLDCITVADYIIDENKISTTVILVQGKQCGDEVGDTFEFEFLLQGSSLTIVAMDQGDKAVFVFKLISKENTSRIIVEEVVAASENSYNSPMEFEGNKSYPFDPAISHPGDPGKHLVIFYQDVLLDTSNPNPALRPLIISFKASVKLFGLEEEDIDEEWSLISAPLGTSTNILGKLETFQAQLQNPPIGGLYKISYKPRSGFNPTESNVLLPLAGAEVKDIVREDLIRADAFVQRVKNTYTASELKNKLTDFLVLQKWFWNDGAGDYLGRPNNRFSPTVRIYNQVNTSSNWGMGAVVTWFGVPVRLAKISNFIIGYAMAKLGVPDTHLALAQLGGERNDAAAEISFFAGVSLARNDGLSSYEQVGFLVVDMFDKTDDDKHKKLWPNPKKYDNYIPLQKDLKDPDNYFSSPGFLDPNFDL